MKTYTGTEDNETYTITISEVTENIHHEKCVNVVIDFDGDVDELSFSEIRKNETHKWLIDNCGIQNEEIENFLTNLF